MNQYTNTIKSKITEEEIGKLLESIKSIQQKFAVYCNKSQEKQINDLILKDSSLANKVKQVIGTEHIECNKMFIIPVEDGWIMSNLIVKYK